MEIHCAGKLRRVAKHCLIFLRNRESNEHDPTDGKRFTPLTNARRIMSVIAELLGSRKGKKKTREDVRLSASHSRRTTLVEPVQLKQ